jgi:hypothetical protein
MTTPGSERDLKVETDEHAYGGKRRQASRMLVPDLQSELIYEELFLACLALFL